ncbi:MAG: FAD-dependent oxidoreductase, partial [Pseudomonadota bacterium]
SDDHPLPHFSKQPTIFVPGEGAVDPPRLIHALVGAAQEKGADLIKGKADLNADDLSVDGSPVRARDILIATGAAPETAPEGLQAVRGTAFLVTLAEKDAGAVPTIVRSPTAYFLPRTARKLYVGATEEWPGAIAATAEELMRDAQKLLPCLADAEDVQEVSGLRPFLHRGGPLIQRDRQHARLIRAQGHHRNGVLLVPLTLNRIDDILHRQ